MELFTIRYLVDRIISLACLLSACVAEPACWRNATCINITESAFPGPWQDFVLAPETRVARPSTILSLADGAPLGDYRPGIVLNATTPTLVFDFGVEVGGIITVNYAISNGPASLGLSFTEAKNWIGFKSDNSNGNYRGPNETLICDDGALLVAIASEGNGSYTVPDAKFRGGFRYLTLFLQVNNSATLDSDAKTSLELTDVALKIGFQPTWPNLRAYQGYFASSDDELNRIWYAGAYTLQTNAAPPEHGRRLTQDVTCGWMNNAWLGPGDSLLLDGAKRDRWVWPGDMGVAVPSAFVSTGDMESVRNALQAIFDGQKSNGIFPRAGLPYLDASSDTYHMWTMIGVYNYVLYTGDTDWLVSQWERYLKAMDYIWAKVLPSGLLNATEAGDWARYVYAYNGSAPNMLLYHTLQTGAHLSLIHPHTSKSSYSNTITSISLNQTYLARAASVQSAILTHLWDDSTGAFKDSPQNRTFHPQDANSMALLFQVVPPTSPYAARISESLTRNWTPIGPASPELPGNISPFISSLEVSAHFNAGRPDRALALVRSVWGWYLAHPNGTGSTMIEGYRVDGSFGYRSERGYTDDASYVSHAHGWSTGPTYGLTAYLVGLAVTEPAGRVWRLGPNFAGVKKAEAGFTTPRGKFSARWEVKGQRGVFLTWDTPVGTKGFINVPDAGVARWVEGGKGEMMLYTGEAKFR
ncbi:alpha-L-rhamnosidase [Xylariaceae sp. FL0016]|nr:alpha-L-rhamnosidase [Xylariaceae sp. FL0016]